MVIYHKEKLKRQDKITTEKFKRGMKTSTFEMLNVKLFQDEIIKSMYLF